MTKKKVNDHIVNILHLVISSLHGTTKWHLTYDLFLQIKGRPNMAAPYCQLLWKLLKQINIWIRI